MKTDAAFSLKSLTLSAVLHGTAFAATGLFFLQPAQVGTQEAPVTAELQIPTNDPPVFPASQAVASKADSKIGPETQDEMPVTDRVEELASDEAPVGSGLPLPVPNDQVLADPVPAGNQPTGSSSSPPRPVRRSASHPDAVVHRGAKNIRPDYLNNPPPGYPESSRLAGEQGVVLVRAEVGASGGVNRVSLCRSSGHPVLDRAAIEAVARWKFHPASAAGIAMTSEVTVPVRFELHQGESGTIRNP